MTDLKPCPFCGGEADVMLSQSRWGQSYTIHHESIGKCPAGYVGSMQFATEAEAIAAWNARAERTCRIDSTLLIEGEYVPSPYYEYEMECGGGFCWDDSEPPTYCPNCGARVIGTEVVE